MSGQEGTFALRTHLPQSKSQAQLLTYSKEPNNHDGVFTGRLRLPDHSKKPASGLHGNMDLDLEVSYFQGGHRPTYLGGLGGGASQLIPHHDY